VRTPRFSVVDQARMALFASLIASGITFMATAATDPFGKSDRAAKHAAGVVLCTQLESNTQRLDQLTTIINRVGMDGLTRNERDVYELTVASRTRLLTAVDHVNATCGAR
jgi:hypothetical protein